jgi:hypothetical protein
VIAMMSLYFRSGAGLADRVWAIEEIVALL